MLHMHMHMRGSYTCALATPPLKLAPAQALARGVTGVSTWSCVSQAAHSMHLSNQPQVYLVGLSSRKIAVGRALARRLQTYRLLDAPALMLSTYKALQGGEATEQLSMEVLMACRHGAKRVSGHGIGMGQECPGMGQECPGMG